jgi:ABC-type transport system involved in cytochrome c biogenesis permease subunit
MLKAAYVLLWVALALYALHLFRGSAWAGWGGTVGMAVAWLALGGFLLARGLAAGHWPLTNRYELVLCSLWAFLIICLLVEVGGKERRWGAWAAGVALLLMTTALVRPAAEKSIVPLVPALRSIWLVVHGLTAAVGYGACGAATALALARLFLPGGERAVAWPAAQWLEGRMGRMVSVGFSWLTMSILSGAVWAEAAWGRWWGWDPKEAWSLVVWLGYLLFFHLRSARGWRGRRLAAVVVGAFALLYVGFVGLSWLTRLCVGAGFAASRPNQRNALPAARLAANPPLPSRRRDV